jgi:threonine/homoserine/homoserine lactone efflux protein
MMISYLFSISALSQIVSKNDRAYLLHLIWLCLGTFALQIYLLFDARPTEHVMASARAFSKSEAEQKTAQIIEP